MTSESTSPVKVLVAEDEPAMLSLVGRHMKSLGFSVVEASDGDMAWDLAAKHQPDLVILDVMMPGMSGWEICKRLKSDASEGRPFAKTGVIMLTGIGENLNEMTSPLFAADAWLNKPFDFNELDGKVRETLNQYGKRVPSPLSDRDQQGNGHAAASEEPEEEEEESSGGLAEAVVKKAASVVEKAAAAVKKAIAPAKKKAAKKAPAKKTTAKKAPAKKATAKKATAKKTTAKKAAKKAPAKKAATKKTSAKAPAKKTIAKASPKKSTAKKSTAKKSTAKKSTAKRSK
ncbi:MAG: response regulator [Polyangiaceae bacterium]|nr:response regulator [Polyangiaceae bacterium]